MKRRSVLSLLLASLLTLSLTSCQDSGESSTAETSPANNSSSSSEESVSSESEEEPYLIHMVLTVAAEGTGSDAVRQAVNELTLRELNMEVDINMQTLGTLSQTLNMQMAANEELDVVPIPSTMLTSSIDSGYLLDLNDYTDILSEAIEGLGDDAYAAYFPETDFLAGLPLHKERVNPVGLVVRSDIMEEIGVNAEDIVINPDDYDSFSQLDDLFAAVKEAYPEMTGVSGYLGVSTQNTWVDGLNDFLGVLENYGQTTTVTNWYESEQFANFCAIAQRWFEAGYESADIATTTDTGATLMRAGNLFSYFTNIKPNTDVEVEAQTGYPVDVIQLGKKGKYSSNIIGCIYSISAASEDPEKAATFMNWMYQSGEFNDLINWGVEGVDWEEKEDGTAGYPEGVDANNVGYHQDFGWIYPNQMAGHAWEGNAPDVWEQYEVFNNEDILPSMANGFNYDGSSVANEVAACSAVVDQYYVSLLTGAMDPETNIPVFNEALYNSGLQTIIDEKQRQLDAWLAEQE